MMDERERLERVVRGFAPPEDAFERLVNRRGRKQRNQRLAAGALGVVVALAMGLVLLRSLPSRRVPGDQPKPVPAGALAYALDGDIFVADPDGSNAVKIADGRSAADCDGYDGEYWAEGSMWSPNGQYLAYRQRDCSNLDAFPGVVISDAQGNVLATFPTGRGWDIRWSPDSTRVAVWDSLGETIGIYGIDGSRQTQLTMPPGSGPGGDSDPWWTRDGTSVWVGDVELPLDGGTPRHVGWSREEIYEPVEDAPDGSLYVYNDAGSLTVERSGGSGSVKLLTVERGTSLWELGFSPEGDRILFSKQDRQGERAIWSIGVDGSDPHLLIAGSTEGDWRPI